MKIFFNSLGVITDFQVESTDSLRQGTVGNRLVAIFEGLLISNYIPTLNFTRSDGSNVSNVGMNITDNNECEVVFDEEWYFALAGNATMTIFLHDGAGNIVAQGQHRITIESTDYDPEAVPPITPEQYEYLLDSIAGKINKGADTLLGVQMRWIDIARRNIFVYERNEGTRGKFTFYIPVDFRSPESPLSINGNAVATEEYVDNAVSGLASESYVDSAVAGLASETYVTEQLENYVTKSALETTLNDYATKNYVAEEIASGLAPYATRDYVNIQIAAAVSNAYKWSGSKTVAELNALAVTSLMHGNVYNVTSDGILNQGNVQVLAGDNVAVVWDAQNNTYSWDKLAGTFAVDLSDYYNKAQVDEAIANSLSYGGFNTISDANDAELNKFYWISGKTTNFPNNDSKVGLLMNMGYSSTYRTQIYILGYGSNAPEYYVRNIVGSTWTNWYQLANEKGVLRNNRQNYDVGPNDADNAVNNTFICVVNKTTNYPYANASGFLYTNYSLANAGYGIQMFISKTTNNTYERPTIYVRSKNNNVFYKWHKLAIEGNPTIQLSMFKSIAACGDSYTAGYSVDKDGTIREKAFQNSWMRTLARKNGIFGGIYAKTGVTTSSWLTDSDCLPALQADSNHYELYIIFLGYNDSVSGFGTPEDIDLENPLNSADTTCGNFAKIKYYIEQKDPNAKIVICKLPQGGANTQEQVDTKNPLIEACATKLGVGCASIPDFPSSNDNVYKQSNHGTNVGYSYLASAIEYGVCKALAMTYYIGFSYDSTENVNKNYKAFLESLYDTASGDPANLVTEDELNAALANINNINCINGSDIIDNTLTEAQFNLLKNGKPTLIVGSLLGGALTNCLINGWFTQGSSTYFRVFCSTGNDNRDSCIAVNNNTRQIFREYGRRTVYENVAYVNGKAIPANPTTNTRPVVPTIAPNGGALNWNDILTLLQSVPGYDATKNQTLKNTAGTIAWVDEE